MSHVYHSLEDLFAQRGFLKDEIIGGGAWALAIDELNRRLH